MPAWISVDTQLPICGEYGIEPVIIYQKDEPLTPVCGAYFDDDSNQFTTDTGIVYEEVICWKYMPEPPEMSESNCKCTFAQRMVGDGCEICNPKYYEDTK